MNESRKIEDTALQIRKIGNSVGVILPKELLARLNLKEGDKFYRFERRFGTFSRSIGLPQGVSEEDIKASYVNGVLEIGVPKPVQPKPKRIAVEMPGEQPVIEGTATS